MRFFAARLPTIAFRFFLVGDPKQAIYSFRGADIFAYLQAAEDASANNIYTLSTNRRSHAKLINSISALFSRENPFVLPEIAYQTVDASREHSHLLPQGNALTVRWLNRQQNQDDDKDNAAKLEKRAASYCASEIAQMLNQSAAGSLKLKGEPLRADQIAVLVRARKDGVLVQRELKKRHIQSVLLSRDSILPNPRRRLWRLCWIFSFNRSARQCCDFCLQAACLNTPPKKSYN